jgi:hypothetical protein
MEVSSPKMTETTVKKMTPPTFFPAFLLSDLGGTLFFLDRFHKPQTPPEPLYLPVNMN